MKPPLRYISRRSSELFFLRTVRVCASVGLGGAELSSPEEVLGKGVIFVACRKAPCSGVRESGCGVGNEEAAISTPTFLFAVNEHYSSGGGGWYTEVIRRRGSAVNLRVGLGIGACSYGLGGVCVFE